MAHIHARLQHWQAQTCPAQVQRYVVAFSGGLDSTVLLHALKSLALRPLLAVHINHGLRPEADTWANHCAALCDEWQISLETRDVCVDVQGQGLEAAARSARYAAFNQFMRAGDALLTGHHQRDQAETLLLQLLRGSGVTGLAAMPEVAVFGPGWLLRPLLNCSREELLDYAQQHALNWLEDPSNSDASLDRNYLRQQVMPMLRARWPAADSTLARAAGHSAQAAGLLDELAQQDMQVCAGTQPAQLSVSALRRLADARRGNLLRYWLRSQGLQPPSTAQLRRIDADLLVQREDAQPLFTQPDYELRRFQDHLYLMQPLPLAPADAELRWDGQGELSLPPGCGRLRARPVMDEAGGLTGDDFVVRFARGGERIRPPGSRHHRRLKTLFQEYGVPPWVRMRMPLIYHGQELVAVADAWLNADYLQAGAQSGWRPQWLDRPPGWPAQAPGP